MRVRCNIFSSIMCLLWGFNCVLYCIFFAQCNGFFWWLVSIDCCHTKTHHRCGSTKLPAQCVRIRKTCATRRISRLIVCRRGISIYSIQGKVRRIKHVDGCRLESNALDRYIYIWRSRAHLRKPAMVLYKTSQSHPDIWPSETYRCICICLVRKCVYTLSILGRL